MVDNLDKAVSLSHDNETSLLTRVQLSSAGADSRRAALLDDGPVFNKVKCMFLMFVTFLVKLINDDISQFAYYYNVSYCYRGLNIRVIDK